mmetsp:Transcript_31410/g.30758  ORF Transcript_31410/g.30758 Transcript_31410/m.30758 type:complete len:102 (+) Transcript_31410:1221-1526(+)
MDDKLQKINEKQGPSSKVQTINNDGILSNNILEFSGSDQHNQQLNYIKSLIQQEVLSEHNVSNDSVTNHYANMIFSNQSKKGEPIEINDQFNQEDYFLAGG